MNEIQASTLTGSPRQIAWAADIVAELPAAIDAYTDRRVSPIGITSETRDARRNILAAAIVDHAATITDAGWWITERPQRNEGVEALARAVWIHIDQDGRNAINERIRTVEASASEPTIVTRHTEVPGVVISVDLNASTETTLVLPGTHPRGPIDEPRTDEDGITSIRWSRVIAGRLHSFQRLVMPSGRIRIVVQRHTGYVDLSSPHAWTHRHFFTFPAPVATPAPTVADLMIAAQRVSSDRAVALYFAAERLLGKRGTALLDAVLTRGQREMLHAQIQPATPHPPYTR